MRAGGDPIVERAATAIRTSRGAQRALLARGHLDFREAQKIFRSGSPGDAEPLFRRAAQELSARGSNVAFVARFFAAYVLYERGNVDDSTRELQELLAAVPEELLTVRARVQWQLAICRGAQGHWGDAIDYAQFAADNFRRAGETNYTAIMNEHIAEGFQLVGDLDTAWTYRAAALQEIGRRSNRLLQAILGFMTQQAIMRGDWDEAASITKLEHEVEKTSRFQPVIADAHLRRARIDKHFGDGDSANEIARARLTISAIPDKGMRSRLDARRVAVEAFVAPTPEQAIPLLTSAIDFQNGPNGQRMFVPTLLFHRARARRMLGQIGEARSDLEAALAKHDDGRSTLKSSEQRTGIFESAESIIDEAIDAALEQKDVRGAFACSERARARSLLDALRSRDAAAAPALPSGTAIIEYAVLPSRIVIFVAEDSWIRVACRPVDREDLKRRGAAFAEALARGDANARDAGIALDRDLIEAIRPWIAGMDTLVIVPDATTNAVPFAALPAPGGGFLIESHTLVSAPSAAVYQQALARHGPLRPRSALILANNAADAPGMERINRTADEARAISALYAGSRILMDAGATRSAFLHEIPHAGLIHFAGHALSSEYSPEETALVLAGADGRINAGEIAALRLSGCSTRRDALAHRRRRGRPVLSSRSPAPGAGKLPRRCAARRTN